ncbi:MFS transporter [Streptomyces mirabilis]|uniref:MFS transporter n=1 Tax=Streptomyces mirabilis TaxID=68239 RepID=UPI00367E0B15
MWRCGAAYGAELFPTAVRNTALGRTYSLSRLVAVILPFCTLPALEHLGAGPVYLACGCLIALMSGAVALLGSRTNAVALEGICAGGAAPVLRWRVRCAGGARTSRPSGSICSTSRPGHRS